MQHPAAGGTRPVHPRGYSAGGGPHGPPSGQCRDNATGRGWPWGSGGRLPFPQRSTAARHEASSGHRFSFGSGASCWSRGGGSPVVLAGAGGGGDGLLGSGGDGVAGAVIGPGLEDQDHGFVEGAGPGVALTLRVTLLLAVLGAGAAELAEGDRIAAGFGQEVTAPSQGVGASAEPVVASGTGRGELPGGGHHLLVMPGAAQAVDLGAEPQRPGGQAGCFQGLGGVLGDVVSDGLRAELAASAGQVAAAGPDGPGVYLVTEPQHHDGLVLGEADRPAGSGGGAGDRPGQQSGGIPGGRRLVVLSCGVEADDGVDVDDAACLVFGDLDVADREQVAELPLGEPGEAGQVPGQIRGEPCPQPPGAGVEQHGSLVVVAVRAQCPAQPGIILTVPTWAGDVAAVRAAALLMITAGAARQHGLAAQQ